MPVAAWIAIVIGGLSILGAFVLLVIGYPSEDSWQRAAHRGDYIGGHLAIAGSFSASCFVIAALLLQRKELSLQRDDLRIQLDEIRFTSSTRGSSPSRRSSRN
ncbi:MAG: hypothetical protein AAGH64_10880 [Planctomycetota bacterium]